MPSFSFLINSANGEPVLNEQQKAMINDFCSEYARLFNTYTDALDNLVFFDQKENSDTIIEFAKSNFHNKEYLESFASTHIDSILQFIEYNQSALGEPKPYPDERIDNMFGCIDYKRDDFALAKLGKIGVHIAGKIVNDYENVAKTYLAPCKQEKHLSSVFSLCLQ